MENKRNSNSGVKFLIWFGVILTFIGMVVYLNVQRPGIINNFQNNFWVSISSMILGSFITVFVCRVYFKKKSENDSNYLRNILNQTVNGKSELMQSNIKISNDMREVIVLCKNMIESRTALSSTMERLAEGDFNGKIESVSDDILFNSFIRLKTEINRLYEEMKKTQIAITSGNLDFRGESLAVHGDFSEIINVQNSILDAVVMPFKMNAIHFRMIANGEIPEKSLENAPGDFEMMQQDLNACVDSLNALAEGNRVLGLMALNDFSEKVETESKGIFNETTEAINELYSAFNFVIDTINLIAMGNMQNLRYLYEAGQQSKNDRLVPSLIALMENISNLVKETEKLSQSAVQGNLDNRGKTDQFEGDYAKVIEGFNFTLDAITEPIKEASNVLNQLSNGNLNVQMTGIYEGENSRIKNDMNTLVAFLNRYVNEITQVLEEMSNGNLDIEISSDYIGDFQSIKTSINHISKSLNEMMSDIDLAAGQVEIGARQISEGGQTLSIGATEQNDSIRDLSSYMGEIATETKRNAFDADQASNLATEVRNNAEESNQQMLSMINAMADINESSSNISKIIKVIDDIAFQTNILALNAAVEAARAGQHGKGFAVVAEEVRTLAARSAEAARETTGLIEGSIDKVAVGSKLADQTAESLTEISEQIEKVTLLVGNMAKSSNAQATDINKIVLIIEQISKVIQNNSITAEESAASSQELSGQAEMLKQMVGTFKLNKGLVF